MSETNKQKKNSHGTRPNVFDGMMPRKKGTTIHERHFPNEMEHILLVAQRISCAVHEFQYFWEFPTSTAVVLGTLDQALNRE